MSTTTNTEKKNLLTRKDLDFLIKSHTPFSLPLLFYFFSQNQRLGLSSSKVGEASL